MRVVFFFVLLLSASVAVAKPVVLASIEPLALALRELYGDQVQVETLMLPQQTPHQVAFTPAQARQVHSADLLVWLGAEAEPALAGLLRHRRGAVLALAAQPGVLLLPGNSQSGHSHVHGSGEPLDPHLWLSADNMRALAAALTRATPAVPEERRAQFASALAEVEARLGALFRGLQDVPWLSAHDPWAYFHRHFGLRAPLVVSASGQAGTSARHFATLAQTMDEQQVHCAVAEPEAGRALLRRLCAAPGCQVVGLDPLARDTRYPGYSAFLSAVGYGFASCLRGP